MTSRSQTRCWRFRMRRIFWRKKKIESCSRGTVVAFRMRIRQPSSTRSIPNEDSRTYLPGRIFRI